MEDWNVVATTRDGGFRRAIRFLGELGPVERTGMFNVLVMKVADVRMFLEDLRARWAESPAAPAAIGRVTPLVRTFDFSTPEEFEARAREAALPFVPALAGKAFHVRFHRRGHKGDLSTPGEERFLDEALLEALRAAGTPGRISFEDPTPWSRWRRSGAAPACPSGTGKNCGDTHFSGRIDQERRLRLRRPKG